MPVVRPIVRLVRRHPLVAYVALACLFGWAIFIAHALGLGSAPDNLPLGPVAAAAVVTACQGRSAIRAWWRRIRRVATSPWLFVLAVLAPVGLVLLNVAVNAAFGAPLPTPGQWSAWPQVFVQLGIFLVMVGFGEEGGWTAFALPLVRARHGLLATWAVLAAIRILWHLPLLLSGQMDWVVWIFGNAGFQLVRVVLAELPGFRWSLAAVWHATLNAVGHGFVFGFLVGADASRQSVIVGVTYGVVGALALLAWTATRLRRGAPVPGAGSLWDGPATPARVGDR